MCSVIQEINVPTIDSKEKIISVQRLQDCIKYEVTQVMHTHTNIVYAFDVIFLCTH